MNNNENSIPWDDPAWLSEDEKDINKTDVEVVVEDNPLASALSDSVVKSPSDDKHDEDDSKFIQEFKQFTINHSLKFNDHHRGKRRVQHNRYQKHDDSSGDLANDIVRDDQIDSIGYQNDFRYADVNSVEEECPQISNLDHGEYSEMNENSTVVKEDILSDISSQFPETDKETFTDIQRKPAIKVYDCTVVRGKYSGKLNDPFQDVREERRNKKGFNRNNRQKQYGQEKSEGQESSHNNYRSTEMGGPPGSGRTSSRKETDSLREQEFSQRYYYLDGSDRATTNHYREGKSRDARFNLVGKKDEFNIAEMKDRRLQGEYSAMCRDNKEGYVNFEITRIVKNDKEVLMEKESFEGSRSSRGNDNYPHDRNRTRMDRMKDNFVDNDRADDVRAKNRSLKGKNYYPSDNHHNNVKKMEDGNVIFENKDLEFHTNNNYKQRNRESTRSWKEDSQRGINESDRIDVDTNEHPGSHGRSSNYVGNQTLSWTEKENRKGDTREDYSVRYPNNKEGNSGWRNTYSKGTREDSNNFHKDVSAGQKRREGESENFRPPQGMDSFSKGSRGDSSISNENHKDLSRDKVWRDGDSERCRQHQGWSNYSRGKHINDDGCNDDNKDKEWREGNTDRIRPSQKWDNYRKVNERENQIVNEGSMKDKEWRNGNSERTRPPQNWDNYSKGNERDNHVVNEGSMKDREWRDGNSERTRPPQKWDNYPKGKGMENQIVNEGSMKDKDWRDGNSERTRPPQKWDNYPKGNERDNHVVNEGSIKDIERRDGNSENLRPLQGRGNYPKGNSEDKVTGDDVKKELSNDQNGRPSIVDRGSQNRSNYVQRNRDNNQYDVDASNAGKQNWNRQWKSNDFTM